MDHEQEFHNLYLTLLAQGSVADADDVDRRLVACLPQNPLGADDADLIVNWVAEIRPHLNWKCFDADRELGDPVDSHEFVAGVMEIVGETKPELSRTPETRTTGEGAEKLRGFEMQFGFDQALVHKLLGTPDGIGSSPSYENLSGLLPKGLLPGPEYDYSPGGHNIHILAECLALRIGDDARALPEVLEACGDVIRRALGEGVTGDRASVYLDEFIRAADRFLAMQPDSLIAIAWRGELACYQGNELEADRRANELWVESDSADASAIAKLLWFFAIADDDELHRAEPFEGPAEPEYCRHLGQRWGMWYDREEPLAMALLRRAANRGQANAEVLRAALALAECPGNGVFNDREILSIGGWLWIAEKGLGSGQYCSLWPDLSTYFGSYYACWQNIWLLSASDPQSPLSFLSSVVLLIHRLFRFGTLQRRVSLDTIFARLESLMVSPEMRSAVGKTVAVACEKFGDRVSPGGLARLQRMKAELGVMPVGPIDGTEVLEELSAETRARDELRHKLGEILLRRISVECKNALISTIISHDALTACSQRQDLSNVVFGICNAIEGEIKRQFWYRIWDRYPDKAALHVLGLTQRDVTWDAIIKLLERASGRAMIAAEKAAFQKLTEWCEQSSVPFQSLVDLAGDLDDVRKCRNQVGHGKPTDEAAPFLKRVFEAGLLRKILTALHSDRPAA